MPLAIFINTEDGLFVASEPVETNDVKQVVKKWSKENGPPERVLIVENGPDGPVVTKDHNIDEKGKVID